MKKNLKFMWLILVGATITLSSCSKDENETNITDEQLTITKEVREKIEALGFSSENAVAFIDENGETSYIVEGDVLLKDHHLGMEKGSSVVIADEEHYRMTLTPEFGSEFYQTDHETGEQVLVRRKESIRVLLEDNFPPVYWQALQIVQDRYDHVSGLRFYITSIQDPNDPNCSPCVRTNEDITIVNQFTGFLGLADPPYERTITTRGGTYTSIEPGEVIRLDPNLIGNEGAEHIATIIAHELGHTIGYRHTDWQNRSYSCNTGGQEADPNNIGAVHIPGTPTGPDSGSWMLACIDDGQNRPFTYNDRVALRYVHGF